MLHCGDGGTQCVLGQGRYLSHWILGLITDGIAIASLSLIARFWADRKAAKAAKTAGITARPERKTPPRVMLIKGRAVPVHAGDRRDR